MESFEKIKKIITELEESGDVTKFTEGAKGATQAGARIRKAMQSLKTEAQTVRNDVQNLVNSRKTAK